MKMTLNGFYKSFGVLSGGIDILFSPKMSSFYLLLDFGANNERGARAHSPSGFSLIFHNGRYIKTKTCIFVNEITKF